MSDFFHGWKRKTGVLTLVLACAFLCGWGRSRISGNDLITWEFNDGTVYGAALPVNGVLLQKKQLVPLTLPNGSAGIQFQELGDILIPYWIAIIPLTLVSAGLLLSRHQADHPLTNGKCTSDHTQSA